MSDGHESSPEALLSAALDYAETGLRVHPLTPRGKNPLTKWQDAATTNPDVIRGWWGRWPTANIGVIVPAGHIVLDIDLYKPETRNELAALEARDGWGPLPETPTCETGGGGEHRWFTVPDVTFRARGKGVELRYAGRNYVVMPPSVHSSGRAYAWRGGDDESAPPVPLPSAWVDGLASTRPRTAPRVLRGDLRAILDGPAGWPTVERFLDALPHGAMDHAMRRALGFDTLAERMRAGAHEALVSTSYRVIATGVEGHPGVHAAIGHLILAFHTEQHRRAATGGPCRTELEAETEIGRALIGAVVKIGGLS